MITDLIFSKDGKILISSGLDEVLNIYSIDDKKDEFGLLKTIPLYEPIESICFIPNEENEKEEYLITIGSKNILKKWNYQQSDCIQETKMKTKITKLE